MVHTEVFQQYSHVDVVEERLETRDICKIENKTIKCSNPDVSLVLLHKRLVRFVAARLTLAGHIGLTLQDAVGALKVKFGVIMITVMMMMIKLTMIPLWQLQGRTHGSGG